MSNQQYRQEEPPQASRLDRLLEARMIIETESATSPERAKAVQQALASAYLERGGNEIESQIEGMMLVMEEGKIYRRRVLDHDAAMTAARQSGGFLPPPLVDESKVSASTMVGASRQLERLAARQKLLREDVEMMIAASLSLQRAMKAEANARKEGVKPQAPTADAQPKQAERQEVKQAPRDQRAATAAA